MRGPLLALTLVAAALLRCANTTPACKAANCAGCCDAQGQCLSGTEASACGQDGQRCVPCGAAATCVASACQPAASGGGPADGGVGSGPGCTKAAELVYVLESDGVVESFDPRLLDGGAPFAAVGTLGCASGGAKPFSMSVDRGAQAWTVYENGQLFVADLTAPALPCRATSFAAQQGVERFGMGFVGDAVDGGVVEQLYVAGAAIGPTPAQTTLAVLGTAPPYSLVVKGTVQGAPELSGTADGKLWAFFPNTAPPAVQRLDRQTGAGLSAFPLPTLAGAPLAWAFAFWGGDFWLFLQRKGEPSTTVYRLSTQTGAVDAVLPPLGKVVVGAGVSTCAPITIN